MKVEIEFFADGVSVDFKHSNGATLKTINWRKQNGEFPIDSVTERINKELKGYIKTEQKF